MPKAKERDGVFQRKHRSGWWVRKQNQLLTRIKSLPVDERTAFDKWHVENQIKVPAADWPGFKERFPDSLK